jgi:hypothetical protein
MCRAGNRILVDSHTRCEKSGYKMNLAPEGGNDYTTFTKLPEQSEVGIYIFNLGLTGIDKHIITPPFKRLQGFSFKSCHHRPGGFHLLKGIRRKIQGKQIPIPGYWEPATPQGIKFHAVRRDPLMSEKDMGSCQGSVPAKVHLSDGREPPYAVAILPG